MPAADVAGRLQALGDAAIAQQVQRFFKTGPGDYACTDRFLGIRVPVLRAESARLGPLPLPVIGALLANPWHEVRLFALLNLVAQTRGSGEHLPALYDLYLANTDHVNNWDLVDCSAPAIVGRYLLDRERAPLYRLAASANWWERRIAVVACFAFIRRGDTDDVARLAQRLNDDRHDLIHKAVGWMLREAGKRQPNFLINLLDERAGSMPRTQLRYATEKLSPELRHHYLSR